MSAERVTVDAAALEFVRDAVLARWPDDIAGASEVLKRAAALTVTSAPLPAAMTDAEAGALVNEYDNDKLAYAYSGDYGAQAAFDRWQSTRRALIARLTSTPPPPPPVAVDRAAFEAALTEYGIARSDFGAARGDERKRERLDIAYDARRALLALVFGDSALTGGAS